MKDGTWWIMFRAERAIGVDDVARALGAIEGAEIAEADAAFAIGLEGHAFEVLLDAAPSVRAEVNAALSQHAPNHRDGAAIAKCDTRFVLRYHLKSGRAAADALTRIETALSAIVEDSGGRTYAYNPLSCEFF